MANRITERSLCEELHGHFSRRIFDLTDSKDSAFRQFRAQTSDKTYPDAARRQGEQGRAIVRFTVDRGGQVLEVQLLSGTGSTSLDDAVEHMLRGARLPAFPPGMDQARVTVTVQIRYRLE